MSATIKDLRISVRLHNNQLRQRREQLGLSGPKFCELHGIPYQTYVRLESMSLSPLTSGVGAFGRPTPITWTSTALRIAKAHNIEPDVLWPESVRAIENREAEIRVNAEEVAALLSSPEALTPDRLLAEGEKMAELEAALGSLGKREQNLIRRRYGLDGTNEGAGETLEEAAQRMSLSRERVRQIEQRALRQLHAASPRLREFIDIDS